MFTIEGINPQTRQREVYAETATRQAASEKSDEAQSEWWTYIVISFQVR